MHTRLDLIDIQLLSGIQDSISEITGLSFSVYDSGGVLLVPSKKEDKFIAQIKSFISVKEEHEKFIIAGIEKSAVRKEASILEGPADQYHVFIPASVNNAKLVFVSSAFYLSTIDFENFLIKMAQYFDIPSSNLESWADTLNVRDIRSVQKMANDIKFIFEAVLRSGYERNLNYKRYQWTKTLIDAISGIKLPVPEKNIYSLMSDAILFHFNVDTIAVMIKEKDMFRTVMSAGKLKEDVKSLFLDDNNPLLSRSVEGQTYASINDILEISRLGFPELITSVHVFSLSFGGDTFGVLVAYNSFLTREETYGILEFCRIVSLALNNLSLYNAHDKCLSSMTGLSTAIEGLVPQLHNSGSIYESIVTTATGLLKAEKGSLMLPEADNLHIKAVKGINRWLIQDIKVKSGEKIAGTVFKESRPLLVSDIKKLDMPHIIPKHHYKTDSFVSVPLKFASETIGVLNISDKIAGDEFTEHDLSLLTHFSSCASILLKMSDYHNLAEQMKELSITDPLTGLFNRRYLQERFVEEIHRSERYNLAFSLLIFDIDDFKIFNDTEGHLAGDRILKEIARISRLCIRSNDILYRLGGEEFAVLMPQTDREKKEAFVCAERIRDKIKRFIVRNWKKFPHPHLTVSIGVSAFPDDGRSIEDLIRCADIALYKAKSSGKDRTVVYGKEE